MKIKDILTIDFAEDIKNVIDLQDFSEAEIQSEIENYIVTDGLAKEYADFISIYTSNIIETGVWISGFYGSGKSYFGKLLGYLISNKMIAGTPARERILQRFTGITDEAIIKNTLQRLNSIQSRVVFLDVAKQDDKKGLAFTLFRNFLRSLELPDNEHGFLLFQLLIEAKQLNIHDFIFENTGQNWIDIKSRMMDYVKISKEIFMKKGNSENDYNNIMETIRRAIDQFSATRLREEISNYLTYVTNEKIVFLFDEASEAINQQKFNLLDLEGVSEALSSLGGRVWTIAIAQEKLDDVINNSNVSKAQLTKVTDRFKTKIHLEATEVDVIIKNRLLKKNENGVKTLATYYNSNKGKISNHASLIGAGITKTDSIESYTTYYPFYKYQFDLLQNFLFGTKGYASTKVAARGMIITTYDILKQNTQHSDLHNVITGWQIAKEGQPQPPVRLVSRYDNAERILREANANISGRKLLETINFLAEAEVTPTTLPNIIKSYISDADDYSKVQDEITKALEILTDAKILLDTNNTYRITSDIEQRLLDEMNGFAVQGFVKKKQLMAAYKAANFTKNVAKITDQGLNFDFYITSDNDDELATAALKHLKIKIKSIYSFSENRSADIDSLKDQHKNDKDLLWLVPDNSQYKELDKLIDEVERITYLEQKFNNPNSEEGKIMISFSTAKGEKQNRIKDLVEDAFANATAIYLYNTFQLTKDNWQTILQTQQRNILQNVYSKRLASQLSDAVAPVIIKEANNARLQTFFQGNDFAFFDANGTFIGENLKVVEEILFKIRNTFVDGATLEKDLAEPPTGFAFGTVMSAVATLMRANKVMAKFNGVEKFSWRDEGVSTIFATARDFRKATFKAISKSLSMAQKQELAQFLIEEIEIDKFVSKKIDFNTNDFDLVNAVRDVAKTFTDKINTLKNAEKEFDKLFPNIEKQSDFLSDFTAAVSEANYIDKAIAFLVVKKDFAAAIHTVEKIEKFISTNLPKVKTWKNFTVAVNDELTKAATANKKIEALTLDFNQHYASDVVKNFASLQQTVQKVKDEYHSIFLHAMQQCAQKYNALKIEIEAVINETNALPADLNKQNSADLNNLLQYTAQRTQANIELDFDVKDKQSRFSYAEILTYIEVYNSKKISLDTIQSSLVRTAPTLPTAPVAGGVAEPLPTTTKTFTTNLPGKKIKISDYKKWLHQELQKLASANDNDDIEIL